MFREVDACLDDAFAFRVIEGEEGENGDVSGMSAAQIRHHNNSSTKPMRKQA